MSIHSEHIRWAARSQSSSEAARITNSFPSSCFWPSARQVDQPQRRVFRIPENNILAVGRDRPVPIQDADWLFCRVGDGARLAGVDVVQGKGDRLARLVGDVQ